MKWWLSDSSRSQLGLQRLGVVPSSPSPRAFVERSRLKPCSAAFKSSVGWRLVSAARSQLRPGSRPKVGGWLGPEVERDLAQAGMLCQSASAAYRRARGFSHARHNNSQVRTPVSNAVSFSGGSGAAQLDRYASRSPGSHCQGSE